MLARPGGARVNLDEQPKEAPEPHKPEQEAQEAQEAEPQANPKPEPRAQGASLQVEQGRQPGVGEAEALPTGGTISEPRFTLAERKAEERRQARRLERADPEGKAAEPLTGSGLTGGVDPEGRTAGPEAEADPEGGAGSEPGPDWQDASSVVPWFGQEIVRLVHLARRQPALTRLRALSQAVDTWSKLLRLSCDTAEIQQIKVELAELRHELEQQRSGPRGVVK